MLSLDLFHISQVLVTDDATLDTSSMEWRPQFALFDSSMDSAIRVDDGLPIYREIEQVFEQMRLRLAASAPSRRFAFFSFACLACASEFREKRPPTAVLYRAKPLNIDGDLFVGDVRIRDAAASLLRRGRPGDRELALSVLPVDYWTGRAAYERGGRSPVPEVLLSGTVNLTRMGGE